MGWMWRVWGKRVLGCGVGEERCEKMYEGCGERCGEV